MAAALRAMQSAATVAQEKMQLVLGRETHTWSSCSPHDIPMEGIAPSPSILQSNKIKG